MSNPSGPDSGRNGRFKPIFALIAAAVIIVSGIAIYGFIIHRSQPSTGSFASEPFPALWQKNFTGTPSSIVATGNGISYFVVDSNNTWTDVNLTLQVYALNLDSGKTIWTHNLTLSDYSNIQPDLYVRNSTLFFIGGGDRIYSNGTEVSVPTSSYAMFVVPINGTTGQIGNTETIDVSSSFGTSGAIAVYKTQLYLAWISYDGNYSANVSAYSAFSTNHTLSSLWKKTFADPASSAGVPLIKVDNQVLLLPLWNLIGLDPSTGKMLFSSPYNTLNTDSGNIVNGALVYSTLYYVSESRVSSGGFDFNLIGMNLTTLSKEVNITLANSPEGIYPLSVMKLGNELVVNTGLKAGYIVTTLTGRILWNQSDLKYSITSGASNVSPGYPVGILGNGNWVLSSVSWSSGASNITTQYFEEINPSNGSLVWMHEFSFSGNLNTLMFVPPALTVSNHVLVISTLSSFMVYRWGNSVGCVAI